MKFRLVLALLLLGGANLSAQERFPDELVRFVPFQKDPVFTGQPGKWDAKIRERGWILFENGKYRLWYTGYDGSKEGRRMLGYAESKDGIHWVRHPGNPLVKDLWVEDMMVVVDRGQYYMFAEGENDQAHLLVSKDGIAWEPRGKLDIRQKNGFPIAEGPFGTPTVLVEDGIWYLFYERSDRGVWLATSQDLKTFTNLQDQPVLKPGPKEYDRDMIALNQVIRRGDTYYAYYHGCAATGPNARLWSTAVARSKDLIHWEKYPGNPLFPMHQNKSSGILVSTGEGPRLYTLHPEVYLHTPPKR